MLDSKNLVTKQDQNQLNEKIDVLQAENNSIKKQIDQQKGINKKNENKIEYLSYQIERKIMLIIVHGVMVENNQNEIDTIKNVWIKFLKFTFIAGRAPNRISNSVST